MSRAAAFLKKKDIEFSVQRYVVDALSSMALGLFASLLIGLVTFFVCAAGVRIGMVFRMRLSRYASIVGGLILIAIGIAIFIG